MSQQLDGRYEILKPLGTGGFGKTFLARDLRIPGMPFCVVKQLHCASPKPADIELARELFHREAESLAKLGHHDQVPRLLAFFTENDDFYLVEDFIDGRSLEDEIKPGQPWSESAVVNLLQSVLEVLAFVHSQGVIHRDIKPGNLIRRKSDGKIVLIDFGAIKQISQAQVNLNQTGTQIGTVGYMPPEQAQGKPRPNSDIFGLGMVAISALTGHPVMGLPDDPQTGEVVWQHLVRVSPGLAQVLTHMVRYYFQHRYQTVEDVQQSIRKQVAQSASAVPAQNLTTPQDAAPQYAAPDLEMDPRTAVVSSPPITGSSTAPSQSALSGSNSPARKSHWLLGLSLAILIPVLGGVAALLFNTRASITEPSASQDLDTDLPCTAQVDGNIRSERTAYQGRGNILQTGQGQSFEIGTRETRGGWIQIKLPSGQLAWTHLDVVRNETALKSCLRDKNITLEFIADIPPPPRPVTPRPTPTSPPPLPEETEAEPSADESSSPPDDTESSVESPDGAETPDSDETSGSTPNSSTVAPPSNGGDDIEESEVPEETAPPSSPLEEQELESNDVLTDDTELDNAL